PADDFGNESWRLWRRAGDRTDHRVAAWLVALRVATALEVGEPATHALSGQAAPPQPSRSSPRQNSTTGSRRKCGTDRIRSAACFGAGPRSAVSATSAPGAPGRPPQPSA